MTSPETLRAESLDLAKRMCDLTTYLASQEFRANTTVEEAYAITEQLHALASAHFHVLRRIELAERRMDFTQQ